MGIKDLKTNYAFVEKNKDMLLKQYLNKFLLIYNEEVIEAFNTYEKAVKEGINKYGTDGNFLVHQLLKKEPVNLVFHAVL